MRGRWLNGRVFSWAAWLAATGCAVGPNYQRPSVDMPATWQPDAPWRAAAPDDAAVKGDWWGAFGDLKLDALVGQALDSNQELRVAAVRLEQARGQVTIAASALYPTLELQASAARSKTSANRPSAGYATLNQSTLQNNFTLGASVGYEFDLFGRVRREVAGARAAAEQSAADFQNLRLVLIAQLAMDYFTLRELDAEIDVVEQSLRLERDALKFVTARHELGYATGLDLAQQRALVDNSAAQMELLRVQRAQNEHAIATLAGTPAPGFAITATGTALGSAPAVPPVGVPSDLLQRRPDVASAERAMAAANARIGVARAAYFPSIQLAPLVPSLGWQSTAVAALLSAPSELWAVGLSATQTLFDAGRTRATVRIAEGDYASAVAGYRQTVLTAFEDVENGITGLASLAQAAIDADDGVASARQAFEIASDRYQGGVALYLDVLIAQQALLADQRQAVQIHGQQFLTTVYLIKALGGGWQAPTAAVSGPPPAAQAASGN